MDTDVGRRDMPTTFNPAKPRRTPIPRSPFREIGNPASRRCHTIEDRNTPGALPDWYSILKHESSRIIQSLGGRRGIDDVAPSEWLVGHDL